MSMWTITLQSYNYEQARANLTILNTTAQNATIHKKLKYPELFSSFNTTLVSLLWSTFGLIEPDNIGIGYNNYADSYLKVLFDN